MPIYFYFLIILFIRTHYENRLFYGAINHLIRINQVTENLNKNKNLQVESFKYIIYFK
jgi:hypothetical protein